MKIQYISDIHLEFDDNYEFFVNQLALKPIADVLIIAGDIARYKKFKNEKYMKFFKYCSENWKYTIFVLGNHDYWDSRVCDIPTQEKILDNVILLNNSTITIDGITFIGTTLWSEISQEQSYTIYSMMNDFRYINWNTYGKNGRLTLMNYHVMHCLSLDFLEATLPDKDASNTNSYIVITHHAPHFNFNGMRQDNSMSTAYYTNLTWLIKQKKINYWICGHTHYNPEDFKIEDTTLTSNMFGYMMDMPIPIIANKVIEI